MDIFDLAAKITLDTSEYEKGLDDAERSGSAFGDKIKGALANGAKITAAAVGALGVSTIALGKAFVSSTGDVAAYGDEIDKASQKIGFSAESYQEWDAVLQHSGTSIEAAKASIRTLSKAAESGSEAFDKLGISQEAAAKMSREELWEVTITALQGYTDEAEKAHIAQELLGRGAMEMGALLNTSAADTKVMRDRVHELGGVMSNEAVKAAASYQDKLQDMKTAMSGLKRTMISDFMPGVSEVMDGLTEIFSGNPDEGIGLISSGIDSILDKLSEKAPEFMETGGKIIESIGGAIIDNLPKLTQSGSKILLELARSIISALPRIAATGSQIVAELVSSLAKAAPELVPAAADAIGAIIDGLIDNAELLIGAGLDLMVNLATGFANAAPELVAKIPEIAGSLVRGVIDNADKFWEAGLQIISAIGVGVFNGIGSLLSGIVEQISGASEVSKALEEITGKVTPFSQALKDAKPSLSDYGTLLSETGKSLQDLDAAIEDSETKITQILQGAAQENRELREEELKEIRDYNDQLRGLWNEKLGIFRDTQVAELRKIQLEANNISQEMAAQYLVDADAALQEANKISEEWYTQDITQIENLHRTTQITDQEYAERLNKAKKDNDDRLAENKRYYSETLTAIQTGGRSWVGETEKTFSEISKTVKTNVDNIGDDTTGGLREFRRSTSEAFGEYKATIDSANIEGAKSFLELLASIKQSGGKIDEESKQTALNILNAFDGLGPTLEAAGTGGARGLVSGLRDFPGLENAGEMTAQEIVNALKAGLDLDSVGSNAASSLSGGLSSTQSKETVRRGAKSLFDVVENAASALEKVGRTHGVNFGDGLAGGIGSDTMYQKVYNAAAKIARAASYAVTRTLQIASPSKVAIGLGRFFGEGMALGVEDQIPEVEKAAREISDALTDPIETPTVDFSANVDGGEPRNDTGIMQQILGALDGLKEGIQVAVYLDDGTLISRIDTGLGTVAQRKARGN